jgi:hypothetical protein
MRNIFKVGSTATIFFTFFVFLSLVFSDALARSKEVVEKTREVEMIGSTPPLPCAQQRVHRMSGVNACVTNWALVGSEGRDFPESQGGCFMENPYSEAIAPSFEFPTGSDLEYLYHGAIWIGAQINDAIYTTVGCDGWFGVYEMWPDAEPQGAIIERSLEPTVFCYSPDAISQQDIIAVYTDTSADIPLSHTQRDPWDNRKHFPLDVRITQKSYSWTAEGYDKFIIAEYAIENIGDDTLSQVYIGFYMDTDITHIDEDPYGSYGAQDDITGFLHIYQEDTVNVAWAADNDGHGDEDGGEGAMIFTSKSPTSVIGMKVLDTPNPGLQMSYNWWNSHLSGTPRDWGPWKAANQPIWAAMNPYGSGNYFPDDVLGTPGGDVSKYFIMSNGEFDYDQIYSCVWPDRFPDEGWLPVNVTMCGDLADGVDIRFLLSFGPFDYIYPNESLHFAVAYIIGQNFHVDPRNLQKHRNNPDEFYANLNFTNLVQNALTAQALYDTLFGPTDVEESEKEIPRSFNLSQNYPNPFNLSTIIQYGLKKTSHVSLKIYNIRGELVRTLVDRREKPGIHRMIWDGKNQKRKEVAGGIYFYELTAGDQTQTKKMILLK